MDCMQMLASPPFPHREPEYCVDHCSHQDRPVKDVWMASAINLEKRCKTFYPDWPKCKECIVKYSSHTQSRNSDLWIDSLGFCILQCHTSLWVPHFTLRFRPGLPPTHGNTNLSHCSAADCSWPSSHDFQKYRSAKYSLQHLLPEGKTFGKVHPNTPK